MNASATIAGAALDVSMLVFLRLILACVVGVAFASVAWVRPARAQTRTSGSDGVHELRYDARIDGAVTLTAGLWMLTSEILKGELVPEKCRWCSRAADGAPALNSYDGHVRNALVWKNTKAADITSSVLAFVALPVLSFAGSTASAATAGSLGYAPVDGLIVAEATLLAANLNQLTKFAFARERPFVRWMPSRAGEAIPEVTGSPSDDNLSFFSGHTTIAFALATSSGTVATLRGYDAAPIVWGAGLSMAAAVGYLRIAADKHYLTDVLTGVVVGSLVGVGVPMVFHGRRSDDAPTPAAAAPGAATAGASPLSLSPPPAAAPLTFRGAW